ncbi:unnamed protein product [Closterium sp. Naga37s-1]|nr:unnamed protein product [Closterium sp. Naga37s-1]
MDDLLFPLAPPHSPHSSLLAPLHSPHSTLLSLPHSPHNSHGTTTTITSSSSSSSSMGGAPPVLPPPSDSLAPAALLAMDDLFLPLAPSRSKHSSPLAPLHSPRSTLLVPPQSPPSSLLVPPQSPPSSLLVPPQSPPSSLLASPHSPPSSQLASGKVQIQRMLAGLSHLERLLRLQEAQQVEVQQLKAQQPEAAAAAAAAAAAGTAEAAVADARAEAKAGEAVLSSRVMARLQIRGDKEDDSAQLMALLRARTQAEEQHLYRPDGALQLARGGGGWGRKGGPGGERSSSGGSCGAPEFAVHGVFSSTGTNSASDAGKKRKIPSPGGPTSFATAAHMGQQGPRHIPHACHSQRSVLEPASVSFVRPNPASAVATSILGSATTTPILGGSATVVDPRILGSVATRRVGESDTSGVDGMGGMGGRVRWNSGDDFGAGVCLQQQPVCNADGLLRPPSDDNPCRGAEGLHTRDEHGVIYQSRATGCTCDVQDECATDDERSRPCQAVGTGSASNQRVTRRSMAERRRRGRISEGLRRLRAKVRGRGDTCAMLDRAVGYVDALEKRVMELEGVVMAAAGSGGNGFPGNAFASSAFGGNVFFNDVATLRAIPAALTSVPTSLGSDSVAGWPWE